MLAHNWSLAVRVSHVASQCRYRRSRGRHKLKTMATIIRKIISTATAPKPVAPYNQAVVADRTVYVSGCLGNNKDTSKLVDGGIVEQTTQALENLKNVLEAADSGLDKVLKTTIFMKDLDHFAAMNEIYKKGN